MSVFLRSVFTLTAGTFFVLLGLFIVSIADERYRNFTPWVGAACAIFGIGIIALHLRERYHGGTDPAIVNPNAEPELSEDSINFGHTSEIPSSVAKLKKDAATGTFRIAGVEVSALTIEAYGKSLSDARRYRGRIVERITPLSGKILQQVSTSLLLDFLPAGNSEAFFYPVDIVRKGELQDGFRVELEGGAPVLVLTYEEYCQLMVVCAETLLESSNVGAARSDHARRLVDNALMLICRRQLASDDYEAAEPLASRVSQQLRQLGADVENDYLSPTLEAIGTSVDEASNQARTVARAEGAARRKTLERLAMLTTSFYDRYPVMAVVPPESAGSNRAVIKYRRNLTPEWCHNSLSAHPLAFLRERIGAFFGAGVSDVDIDVRRASRAQSYHIEVYGADSSYVGHHRLTGLENYVMDGHPSDPRHVRFGRLRGQPYTHWYFRDLARKKNANDDELTLHVSFFETPPSSLAKATFSAFASTLLIYIVGLIVSVASQAAGSPSQGMISFGSDFPALVLVFPAVAAAWVGMDRGVNALLVSEIGARLSSFITMLLSVASSGLFMAQNAGLAKLPPLSVALLGSRDPLWLILTTVALANLILTMSGWIGRSVRYFSVLRGATGNGISEGIPSVSTSTSENLRES